MNGLGRWFTKMTAAATSLLLALGVCVFAGEELIVYTALEDDEIVIYKKDWEAKHPEITLKIVRDSTGIMTAKLLAEKDNPQADVVWGTAATSLMLCDQVGMLKGYKPEGLDKLKKSFYDQKHDEPHWVGIKAWMTGFANNTIETKKLGLPYPKSYEDLIKPVYKGKLVMPNPASSGTGFLTVSAILQLMGEEEGWKYLDKLHENIAVYTHSGSKPAKMAGKGEYPIGISFAYRAIKQKKSGEPIELTMPKEGSGYDLEANALINKPKIKKSAKLFLDWAIGEDCMKMYSKIYPIIAMEMPIDPELIKMGYPEDPAGQLLKNNDFDWAAKNRDRILKEWSKRYDAKSAPK